MPAPCFCVEQICFHFPLRCVYSDRAKQGLPACRVFFYVIWVLSYRNGACLYSVVTGGVVRADTRLSLFLSLQTDTRPPGGVLPSIAGRCPSACHGVGPVAMGCRYGPGL